MTMTIRRRDSASLGNEMFAVIPVTARKPVGYRMTFDWYRTGEKRICRYRDRFNNSGRCGRFSRFDRCRTDKTGDRWQTDRAFDRSKADKIETTPLLVIVNESVETVGGAA